MAGATDEGEHGGHGRVRAQGGADLALVRADAHKGCEGGNSGGVMRDIN